MLSNSYDMLSNHSKRDDRQTSCGECNRKSVSDEIRKLNGDASSAAKKMSMHDVDVVESENKETKTMLGTHETAESEGEDVVCCEEGVYEDDVMYFGVNNQSHIYHDPRTKNTENKFEINEIQKINKY